jgi:hypothetical protein
MRLIMYVLKTKLMQLCNIGSSYILHPHLPDNSYNIIGLHCIILCLSQVISIPQQYITPMKVCRMIVRQLS